MMPKLVADLVPHFVPNTGELLRIAFVDCIGECVTSIAAEEWHDHAKHLAALLGARAFTPCSCHDHDIVGDLQISVVHVALLVQLETIRDIAQCFCWL
ncbi:hypothetical protein D3C71_1665050 [compost metagenome]